MPAVTTNGITIEYDIHGDDGAPPLLLVMGLGGQLVQWTLPFVEQLADRGFRVIRFDNRNIGLSSQVNAPAPTRRQILAAIASKRYAKSAYTLADMADDTAGLLDAIGVEQAHVVGVSMGGMISQSLAIRHPRRVASLTSIMSNTGDRRYGARAPVTAAQGTTLHDARPCQPRGERDEDVRLISGPHFDAPAVRAMLEESSAAATISRVPPARRWRSSPARTTWDLRRVQAPTLVVHGLVDRLVMPSGGIATAAIPGSRLVMYPDMGHDLPEVRWGELMEEIVLNASAPRAARRANRRRSPEDRRGRGGRASEPRRPRRRGRAAAEIWIAVAERTGIDELRGRPVTSRTTTC